MKRKNRPLPLVMLAGLSAALLASSGCVPLVVAGGAAGASAIAQERSVGTTVNDLGIETEIEAKMLAQSAEEFAKVNVKVSEGRVLLTGRVQDPEQRIEAARIAWEEDEVVDVINEIEVGDSIGFSGNTKDAWISTRLRVKIVAAGINFTNYSFEVLDRKIYVFGLGKSQEELDEVVRIARDIDGVRDVIVHARVPKREVVARIDFDEPADN